MPKESSRTAGMSSKCTATSSNFMDNICVLSEN